MSWRWQRRLDYETKTSYNVEVTATDLSGENDTIPVAILVTDVDLGTAYDVNHDEKIDRDEVLAAVADYSDGEARQRRGASW